MGGLLKILLGLGGAFVVGKVIADMTGGGSGGSGGTTTGELGSELVEYRGFTLELEPVNGRTRWRAIGLDGEPIENGFGFENTPEQALAAGKAWLDVVFPMESSGGPMPPIPSPNPTAPSVACEVVKPDGEFSMCLYQNAPGKWAYRLTRAGQPVSPPAIAMKGGYASRLDATIAAWRQLSLLPTAVVDAPSIRNGLKLDPDGTLRVVDMATYRGYATPILAQEIGKGEADPAGLILSVFLAWWPQINPFRMKINGGTLAAAVNRVKNVTGKPGDFAVAMFGPYSVGGDLA